MSTGKLVGDRRQAVNINNANFVIRDGFEFLDNGKWDVQTAAGDVLVQGGNTAGSGYLKISKSLDQEDTETIITSKFVVTAPVRLNLGMSLSQRIAHQRFSLSLVGVDDNGNVVNEVPVSPALNISSVSQATTTLTVTTSTPHGLVPGDRVHIWGISDSRLNYGEVYVATISSPTVFTVTNTPYAGIPSVTAGPFNNGYVQKVDPLLGASNEFAIVWEGTNASNAKLVSRSNKSAIYNSSDTSLGTNNTNATVANGNAFADAFNPSYMYDIRYRSEAVLVRTMPMDSLNPAGAAIKRSQIIPDIASGYKIRIRARNNKALSRPVAKIVSAVKSASTTATITTDIPHGLTTGDQVLLLGMRDQTNFANVTSQMAVASTPTSTTFTVAFGASATATSYGGTVVKCNGGFAPGISGQSIQSVSVSGGLMTIVGSGNWSGFSIGETIELRGIYDTAGVARPDLEGVFQVANMSTTTLTLFCNGMTDMATVNCGGAVFKRTDLRLHLFRALDYTRATVEMDGAVGNHTDYQEALPVGVLNMPSITVGNGQTAHDSAITGSPVRIGGRALTSNYAAVQTGDAADLVTTLVGALIQKPFSIPEADWTYAPAAAITGTTDTALKAAPAAGIRNYLTGMQIQNSGTVATEVVVKDGATVIWRGYAPASMSVVADMTFPTPLRTTAATALNFACITAGANVYVNAQGYQAP